MKAHRTDGVSLTFALIFLGVAAWWLFAQLTQLALPAVGWLLASALIVVGGLGLMGALRSSRSARRQTAQPGTTSTTDSSAPSTTLVADAVGTGSADAPTREFDRPTADEPTARLFDRPLDPFDRPTTDLFDRPTPEPLDYGSDRDETSRAAETSGRDDTGTTPSAQTWNRDDTGTTPSAQTFDPDETGPIRDRTYHPGDPDRGDERRP
ncbi:phage holin family protein [Plantactinospora soyae]|uniref:Uncharacterized protein n=1 Tax=Plantactinospora soyae TaxID=1544732 RepID=A0A927LZ33_9ACTN|nr:hypothetical protein [Plantactinospora soyae]